MNYEEISALLEKYWDGESTLDEERALKTYFAKEPVDERLRNVAPLFAALRADKAIELRRDPVVQFAPGPATVWRRWTLAAAAVALLITAGWWWMSRPAEPLALPALAETPRQITPVPIEPQVKPPALIAQEARSSISPRPKRHVKPGIQEPPPVVADPAAEQAMEEIKAALALVSSKLNKGKQEASKSLHEFETVDKMIRKPGTG
jgi:hypothetical protein